MISTYCGDIIDLVKDESIDAIVNPANHELAEGGTLCGEIYHHAGPVNLNHDLHSVRGIAEGSAIVTSGHNLCEWIIHTLAPRHDSKDKWESLKRCYLSIAQLTSHLHHEAGLETVAVPAIGTGAFGLDQERADEIAYNTLFGPAMEELRFANVVLVFIEHERFERVLGKRAVRRFDRDDHLNWVTGLKVSEAKGLDNPFNLPQPRPSSSD